MRCGPRYGREATRKRQAFAIAVAIGASAGPAQCYRGAAIADMHSRAITIGAFNLYAPMVINYFKNRPYVLILNGGR